MITWECIIMKISDGNWATKFLCELNSLLNGVTHNNTATSKDNRVLCVLQKGSSLSEKFGVTSGTSVCDVGWVWDNVITMTVEIIAWDIKLNWTTASCSCFERQMSE